MKFVCICVMALAVVITITANAQSFDTFQVNHPTIVWNAKTNYQSALWIYKVTTQQFSVKAVNNLLKIGGFTNRLTNGKQGISVSNSSNRCNLVVYPAQGIIRYGNLFAAANHWDRTNHLVEPVKELPDDKQVEKLGLKLLKQFGIQRKDLAQKEDGHLISFGENTTRGYFDRRTGKYIDNEVLTRGIIFNRRIDSVNFAGIGVGSGCQIEFGNSAKISKFNLVWRNLKPYEQCAVKRPDEIAESILNGDAVLTHKNFVEGNAVQAITITEFSPLYMGADEMTKQDVVSPFGKIEAVAYTGTTNIQIELYCPILTTNRILSKSRRGDH